MFTTTTTTASLGCAEEEEEETPVPEVGGAAAASAGAAEDERGEPATQGSPCGDFLAVASLLETAPTDDDDEAAGTGTGAEAEAEENSSLGDAWGPELLPEEEVLLDLEGRSGTWAWAWAWAWALAWAERVSRGEDEALELPEAGRDWRFWRYSRTACNHTHTLYFVSLLNV